MHDLIRYVRVVLDRPTKLRLLLASAGQVLLAIIDMAAIALVYPLVSLASGTPPDSSLLRPIRLLFHSSDTNTLLVTTATIVVLLFVAKSTTSIIFNWWLAGFTNQIRANVSTHLLCTYLTTPYGVISRRSTGDLLKVQQDAVNQFTLAGVYALMTSVSHAATILGISMVLLFSAPIPTLALVAYFTIAGAIYLRIVRPAAERAGREAMTSAGQTWRSAMTALGAIKEVQLRSAQPFFVDRYGAAVNRAAQAHRISGFLAGLPRHILEVLFVLAIGLAIVLTSRGQSGEALGVLGLFVAAGFRLLPAVTGLLGNVSTMQVSKDSARHVADDWRRLEEDPGNQGRGRSLPFNTELLLTGVSYQYPDGAATVLDNISLRVPNGNSLAIVGPSGSGKTTFVDLILGFYEPSQGSITVDGISIHEDIAAWRLNVAYVPQDVFLIEGTIEENISFAAQYSDPKEHQEVLDRVIRQADLLDLIESLPDGLATQVGERGSRFSGGQKQRIGMARALYRQPRLLVLDEATSALDNVTEHRVAKVLHDLGDDVTIIVVAHRLSTVKEADAIAIIEGGKLGAVGTFDDLKNNNATFADLVRLGDLS